MKPQDKNTVVANPQTPVATPPAAGTSQVITPEAPVTPAANPPVAANPAATTTATEVKPGVFDLNTQQLPGIPAATDAEKLALIQKQIAEREAVRQSAEARFDLVTGSTFRLEGQIIGQAIKKKTSPKGGVRLGLLPAKEMSVLSGGMKGEDLKNFTRMRADELKNEENKVAMMIAGDRAWTGAGLTLNAKGDKITLEYKKVAPVTVSVRPPQTDEELAKELDITVEEVRAMKKRKAEKADAIAAAVKAASAPAASDADKKAEADLAKEEAERIAKSAKSNGAVENPAPADAATK